jgi:4-amino-4-deoxy-L-arabinose transferase-like glycosyltransferase
VGKRLLLIILFAAALWIPGYLRRDLWQPDEARYAYVAQEMRAGNHWFVPRRHGQTYAHKPPLMFWLINAASCLTRGEIGTVATRLPSLLGVILALWAVGTITKLWVDGRTAWRAVFITATTIAIWWRAGWGQIDMLLCGLQMTALCLLFLDDERRSWWRPLLAYCCFGLGILAKGPVGFVVPCGAYIAANLVGGTGRNLRRWHWIGCLPITLLWPGAWLLLAKLTGGPQAYFQELLFDQNIDRAAGGLGHIRPFYYYLENLCVEGLPWILILPFAVWALLKAPSQQEEVATPVGPVLRRALGWFGFVFLFFTMLPTKRSLYILLAYPAMAIIVSTAWPFLRNLPRKALGIAFGLMAMLVVGCVVGIGSSPWLFPVPVSPVVALPCAAILIGGASLLLWRFYGEGLIAYGFIVITGTFVLIYLIASIFMLPAFNTMKTPVALIPEVQKRVPEGKPLLLYKMHSEIMPLYCKRPGKSYWSERDLRAAMRHQKRGVAVFVDKAWEASKETFGPLGETGTFSMGHRQYVWLAYEADW